MIIWDMEIYKHNWMISYLDTDTRTMHTIHDNIQHARDFYNKYKNTIMIGYNSNLYDRYCLQGLLAGFNPYEISDWIINQDRRGWEFSRVLQNFPILSYDCRIGFRSLKELEAFLGDDIQETQVPFDIDRPLTKEELELTRKYNIHDVWETFKVFIESKVEFESHIGLIEEFKLPMYYISKTKAQLSAEILGATSISRDDEFAVRFPDTLKLGKYEYIKDFFQDWADNIRDYNNVTLKTTVGGIPTVCSNGGLHSAIDGYMGDGTYVLADVSSFYPAIMIEYDFLSRNVSNPNKFKQIRDERIVMKANKDPRQQPRKIVLNATYGCLKDKYNKLYDPQNSNNVCFGGQLLLIDLIEKLENHCQIIQSNTDGVLVKLYNDKDLDKIKSICDEWSKRTRMELEYEIYKKVIQKDVNNYIMVADNGYVSRKGSFVKELHLLDNDSPIVNKAVVDYFTKDIPVETTINSSNKLIDFQKITKISSKYEYGSHNGKILQEKVHRCFASLDPNDGTLYKKHKNKVTLDKTPSTPENCFIDNSDITEKVIPAKLDKNWYVELAKYRISKFV